MDSIKPEVKELKKKIIELEAEIDAFRELLPQLEKYKEKRNLYNEVKDLGQKIKESSSIVLHKNKKSLTRVIKRMGLVEKGVVTRKGNVTCEISSNHEILLT